jgi:hypothetical protein
MARKNFTLTRVQKKQVRAIASKTVEKKAELLVYQPAAVVTTPWIQPVAVQELFPTYGTQGDESSMRTGDRIQWKGLHVKATITPGTDKNAVMRCMIVQYRGSNSSAPTAPPLSGWSTAGPPAADDQINFSLFYLRKRETAAAIALDYKVIYDQIWRFDATNATIFVPLDVNIKESDFRDNNIVYQTGSTVHDSPVYMFIYSDQTDATSTGPKLLNFQYRSSYIDL